MRDLEAWPSHTKTSALAVAVDRLYLAEVGASVPASDDHAPESDQDRPKST